MIHKRVINIQAYNGEKGPKVSGNCSCNKIPDENVNLIMPGPFDSFNFYYILYFFDFCRDRRQKGSKKKKSYKHEMEEGREEKKSFHFHKNEYFMTLDIQQETLSFSQLSFFSIFYDVCAELSRKLQSIAQVFSPN